MPKLDFKPPGVDDSGFAIPYGKVDEIHYYNGARIGITHLHDKPREEVLANTARLAAEIVSGWAQDEKKFNEIMSRKKRESA